MTDPGNAELFQPGSKTDGIHLLPVNGKRHVESVLCQDFFQPLSFLFQNLKPLCLAGLVRRLFIRHFHNFQLSIAGQTLCIFRDRIAVKALLYFSNA